MKVCKVSHARKGSTTVCERTLQRRSASMEVIRGSISGNSLKDSACQIANEQKRRGVDERRDIMKKAGFEVEVPPGEGIAFKSNLAIPWNKLRLLRRYAVLEKL